MACNEKLHVRIFVAPMSKVLEVISVSEDEKYCCHRRRSVAAFTPIDPSQNQKSSGTLWKSVLKAALWLKTCLNAGGRLQGNYLTPQWELRSLEVFVFGNKLPWSPLWQREVGLRGIAEGEQR